MKLLGYFIDLLINKDDILLCFAFEKWGISFTRCKYRNKFTILAENCHLISVESSFESF